MKYTNISEMIEFDKWLFQVPWRLERYYDIVPGLTEQDKLKLKSEYENTNKQPKQ